MRIKQSKESEKEECGVKHQEENKLEENARAAVDVYILHTSLKSRQSKYKQKPLTTVLTWVCQEGQVHCGPILLGFSLLPHVLEDEAQPLPCPVPITW